jgi:hypothetical protein
MDNAQKYICKNLYVYKTIFWFMQSVEVVSYTNVEKSQLTTET